MLTTKFYHSDGSLWLTSELANKLSNEGHDITVLNLEWSSLPSSFSPQNIKLLNHKAIRIRSPFISVAFRWLFSSFKLLPFLLKSIFNRKQYDLLIAFSPCTALYLAIPFAQLLCQRSTLIYWDFFPIHNQEISKKSPKALIPILKYLEKRLVHSFAKVGVMSPANVHFYESYFGIPSTQNVTVIPVWTSFTDYTSPDRETVRKNLKIESNSIVVVFGGQLVEGRGIIELCQAIINANQSNDKIILLICGSGNLMDRINLLEKEYPTLIRPLGFIKREKYLNILCASDIGVISTVAGVSSPSYPSKSLDYMACGLPILAAIENASDFGEITETNHFGISCSAGDVSAMTTAILRLASDEHWRKELGHNGKQYLQSTHDISKIVTLITGN